MKIFSVKNFILTQPVFCLVLAIFSSNSHADSIDLTQILINRNELVKSNEKIKFFIHDREVQERLDLWINHPDNFAYIMDCQKHLGHIFRSKRVLSLMCYFLRNNNESIREKAVDLMNRYMWEKKIALADVESDPRYKIQSHNKILKDSNYSEVAHELRLKLESIDSGQLKECLLSNRSTINYVNKSIKLSSKIFNKNQNSPFFSIASCLESLANFRGMPVLQVNFSIIFLNHPSHATSETGWVGGNQVQYLTYNRTDPAMIEIVAKNVTKVQKLYPLEGAGSRQAMREAIRNKVEVFSEAEGFYNVLNDPTWSQSLQGPHGELAIFPEILKGINSAKESIFIDIFFLGGTMGASLAKHLVSLVESNPNLKVFLIRDLINHFGHEREMLPIYNYLKEYSLHNPKQMVVVPAHIKSHKSGLPKFLWGLASDDLFMRTGIQEHLALYGRATSDHSKVIVIDGTTETPIAYVGSKNLTDASGAVCWDEVVKVSGPAATLVLDDYYEDMLQSLLGETPVHELIRYSNLGWSKDLPIEENTKINHAVRILQPFDVLKRNTHREPSRTKIEIPSQGTHLVRNGFNNYDSTRASALDQVIQAILFAHKKILIKDQFLFDRNIVLALIRAKKAKPNLDVRVILEPLSTVPIPGMPNLLFLDVLRDAGILVKFKKTNHHAKVSQEYHMKTMSVDDVILISGSANKDQTTMYGAFREQQLEVYDRSVTSFHDSKFEREWNEPSETTDVFKDFNFKVPSHMKGLDGKTMSEEEMVQFFRNLIALLYDASPPGLN